MPISKNWSKATVSNIKRNVPKKGGVYGLKCFGEQVYVGSSKNLQNSLLTHLSERSPNSYRFKTAGFLKRPISMERSHYDCFVDKHGASPQWNSKRP